jgi:hypothetical protein
MWRLGEEVMRRIGDVEIRRYRNEKTSPNLQVGDIKKVGLPTFFI